MTGYVKSIKTFSTTAHFTIDSFVLYPETSSGKSGSATAIGELPDYTGNWLYLDGKLWIIGQSKPDHGKTTLKLLHPISAFDRNAIYTEPATTPASVGAFILSELTAEFISVSDTEYQMSYITATNSDTTTFVAPVTEDGNIFNIADYINTARRSGVDISFTVTNTGISIRIFTKQATSHNVLFDDGHSKLESVTFSRESCAKLTVQKATETEGTYTTTTYYLASDGSISATVPSSRATGTWDYTTCGKDDDALTTAQIYFAENSFEHKIEFYSDREFGLYDTMNLSLPTGLFKTQINEIQKSSTENRTLYTCGDLPTTLTEQFAAAQKEKESSSK